MLQNSDFFIQGIVAKFLAQVQAQHSYFGHPFVGKGDISALRALMFMVSIFSDMPLTCPTVRGPATPMQCALHQMNMETNGNPTLVRGEYTSIWLYPKNEGPRFGSPYDEDHGVFWSILGPSTYGNPHMCACASPLHYANETV